MPALVRRLSDSLSNDELLKSFRYSGIVHEIVGYLKRFTSVEQGGFFFLRIADGTHEWKWLPMPSSLGRGHAALYEPPEEMSPVFELEDAGWSRIGSAHNHPFWRPVPSGIDRDMLFKDHRLNLIFSNVEQVFTIWDCDSNRVA